MVKAPIVSRADDHKRWDLRIRPEYRHFVAIHALRISSTRTATSRNFAWSGPASLSHCGTVMLAQRHRHK